MLGLVSTFLAVSGIWIISLAWKFFNMIWLKPKRIEKLLRDQGVKGTSYKFLHGNAMEMATATSELKSMSKPTELSHQILPRAMIFPHQMVEKYGKMSFYWTGTLPTVIILDPDLIREALNDKSGHFQEAELHPVTQLLETGLFSYVGEKWTKHRRILSPAFRQERLRLMLPMFYTCCRQMVEKWQNLIFEGSVEVDVHSEFHSFAGDIISRTTFGNNFEEGRRVSQLQEEQAALFMELIPSLHIPGIQYFPTRRIRRMKAIHREVRDLLTDVINKRERAMKSGETYDNDLLSILMESNFKEINSSGKSKKAGMTTNDIIEECKMFYMAGQETVSLLLTWTMVVLSMHPDWQEKAREEVLSVFGRNAPYFDGLNQLKTVTMILNEVLRLYSPVTTLTRVTLEKVKLGEVMLPAGVQVMIPLPLVHHDHELWGEDVDKFKPGRLTKGATSATNNENSFFPFGWGPRMCIGQFFALVEAKMAMTIILQHFSFELSPTYTHAPILNGFKLLMPQHGAKLILHKL